MKNNPTVREILKKYLDENGYDGLYNDDCGCETSDLMPCCDYCGSCQPGYKVDPPSHVIAEFGSAEWVMMGVKPGGGNDD